ncbi:unnamed protein product [Cyberlindnera jadinii]|nr:unnamed protein product [Cyberlindnera jadinii]
MLGYICLVSSMCLMLFNSEVRTLYYEQHGYEPLLTKIDLVYSVHGILLTSVSISQLFCWGFKSRPIVLKRMTKVIITVVILSIFAMYSSIGTSRIHSLKDSTSEEKFTLLSLALSLSYMKIIMSLIKYFPQLLHNHKRKSVLGFSMLTIFLDCTGGTLSIAQLFLDGYIATGRLSWDMMISNGGKLWLSFVTLFFDGCFIYQWLKFEKWAYKEHEKISA